MNFTQKLSSVVKKHMVSIQKAHDRRLAEAEKKARARLARATTKAGREKAMLQLRMDRANLRRELSEAQIATQKAEKAAKVARLEAGDLTFGERLAKSGREFGRGTMATYKILSKAKRPARRRRVIRKTTVHKTVAKKRVISRKR
jgi:hypothetical protein